MYARDFLYSSTHKVPSQPYIAASLASSKLSQLSATPSVVQPIVIMPSEQSFTLHQTCLLIADASPEHTKRALITAVVYYSELAEAIASELIEVDHIPDDRLLIATPPNVTDITPGIESMSRDMCGQVMVKLPIMIRHCGSCSLNCPARMSPPPDPSVFIFLAARTSTTLY